MQQCNKKVHECTPCTIALMHFSFSLIPYSSLDILYLFTDLFQPGLEIHDPL